jgi:sister chromatid cohesion protein PDS5
VKQTRDGIKPSQSENLYVISDLAQTLLRKWQERRNWVFQAFSGKVGLPIGLYTALPSHEVAQEIAEKQYLPEGVDERLDELLRSVDKKKVRYPVSFNHCIAVCPDNSRQKRKSADERAEGHHAPKKIKAERVKISKPKGAAKSAKVSKKAASKKSTTKVKKGGASSSLAADSADRRRSGRAKKNSSPGMATTSSSTSWAYLEALGPFLVDHLLTRNDIR